MTGCKVLSVCLSAQINNKDELVHQLREDLECLHRQQKETTSKVNKKKQNQCGYVSVLTVAQTFTCKKKKKKCKQR